MTLVVRFWPRDRTFVNCGNTERLKRHFKLTLVVRFWLHYRTFCRPYIIWGNLFWKDFILAKSGNSIREILSEDSVQEDFVPPSFEQLFLLRVVAKKVLVVKCLINIHCRIKKSTFYSFQMFVDSTTDCSELYT